MSLAPKMTPFPALPEAPAVWSQAAAGWLRRYRRFWQGSLDRLAAWLDEDKKKREVDDRRKE